mgnify:CR=1 FL=1
MIAFLALFFAVPLILLLFTTSGGGSTMTNPSSTKRLGSSKHLHAHKVRMKSATGVHGALTNDDASSSLSSPKRVPKTHRIPKENARVIKTVGEIAKTATRVVEHAEAAGWGAATETEALSKLTDAAQRVVLLCEAINGVKYYAGTVTAKNEKVPAAAMKATKAQRQAQTRFAASTVDEQSAATSMRLHALVKLTKALANRAKKLHSLARKCSKCRPARLTGQAFGALDKDIGAMLDITAPWKASSATSSSKSEQHDGTCVHSRTSFRPHSLTTIDPVLSSPVQSLLFSTENTKEGSSMARRVYRQTKERAVEKMKEVLIERKVRSPSEIAAMAPNEITDTFKVELVRGGHDPELDMGIVMDVHVGHPDAPADLPDILSMESEKRIATAAMKDILLLRSVRTLDEINAMDANEVRDTLKVEAIEKLHDEEHAHLNMWAVSDTDLLYLAGKLKELHHETDSAI